MATPDPFPVEYATPDPRRRRAWLLPVIGAVSLAGLVLLVSLILYVLVTPLPAPK